jgi:hypothetical protein
MPVRVMFWRFSSGWVAVFDTLLLEEENE